MFLFSVKMNDNQQRAIYEFGAASQLLDDFVDINIDLKSGVKTIPNQNLLSYPEIKKMFFGSINKLIFEINIDPNHPNVFLEIIYRLFKKIEKTN